MAPPAEYSEPTDEQNNAIAKAIYEVMNEPNLREIYIQKQDGELHRINNIKREDGTRKVIELLQSVYSGEIRIKKNNGKVVFQEINERAYP